MNDYTLEECMQMYEDGLEIYVNDGHLINALKRKDDNEDCYEEENYSDMDE